MGKPTNKRKNAPIKSLPVNELNIAGITYPVDLVKADDMNDEGGAIRGEADCDYTYISINEDNSIDHAKCVLMHEAIEQIDHRYNMGLKHHQIYLLEAALVQLLRDNPDFVAFIMS